MDDFPFQVEMAVRDYECDMQGIVNNAVYQNYLEHARHEFLKSIGVDFAELTRQGIHLVVVRIELDYKQPLQSGDKFIVKLRMERESRIRFAFHQVVERVEDNKVMVVGKVIGASLGQNGRPKLPTELEHLLAE